MNDLYRLVYTSRNLLDGGEDERSAAVAGILAVSKRNNARVGVTGALLFNAGSFAQVLEGPRAAVEATFERIQRDPRHSDVSVIQCEPVAERGFSNWSMAFIGHSARGRAMWQEMALRTGFNLAQIEGEQLFTTLLAIVEEEEGPAPLTPTLETTKSRGEGLDVERLRIALRAQTPDQGSAAPFESHTAEPVTPIRPVTTTATPSTQLMPRTTVSAEIENGVLRASLDDERQRTTDLRRELDAARSALVAAQGDVESLGRHRDIWADRSLQLRSTLNSVRADLAEKTVETAALSRQLAVMDEEVGILRRHRDIWAERAKAIAAAMCRDPDSDRKDPEQATQVGATAERERRPSLVKAAS